MSFLPCLFLSLIMFVHHFGATAQLLKAKTDTLSVSNHLRACQGAHLSSKVMWYVHYSLARELTGKQCGCTFQPR